MQKLLPILALVAIVLVVVLLQLGGGSTPEFVEPGLTSGVGVQPVPLEGQEPAELEAGPRRQAPTVQPSVRSQAGGGPVRPTQVEVVVITAAGQPTAARVHVAARGEQARPLGHTDATGRAEFMLEPGAWTLLASADRHAPASASVAVSGGQRKVRLRLASAGAIDGKVLRIDGRPASVGVTVLAWRLPGEDPVSLLKSARSRISDPRLARTKVANDGTFRIEGLDPAKRYAVRAVSPTDYGRPPRAVPVGSSVEIRLRPLYAKEFVIAGSDGLPLERPARFSEGVSAAATLIPSVPPGTVEWLGIEEHIALGLTALGPSLERGETDAMRALWIGVPPSGRPSRIGPIPIRIALPGYQILSQSVWLDPLRGALPQEILRIETKARMGSVRVQVQLTADVEAALRRGGRPLGALLLDPARGQNLWLALPPLADFPIELPLPSGGYNVQFTSRDGSFGRLFRERQSEVNLGRIVLAAGGSSELTLDLSDRSAVELDVRTADGVRWTREVLLDVEAQGGQLWPLPIERAPYVLFGLPEGTWRVGVNQLTGFAGAGALGASRVEIPSVPGAFQRATLGQE